MVKRVEQAWKNIMNLIHLCGIRFFYLKIFKMDLINIENELESIRYIIKSF
jgi:hypothetical protein